MSAPVPSAHALTVECYDTRERIAALYDEWLLLWAETATVQPFCRPEWIESHLRFFAPKATPLLLAVREHRRLIALLPLLRDTGIYHGFPVRRIRAVADAHTAQFDILFSGSADRAFRAICNYLRQLPSWDCLQLPLLPRQTTAEPFSFVAASNGYPVVRSSVDSLFIPLTRAPEGPAPWLYTVSSQTRRFLRRQERHAEERFGHKLCLERVHAADPAQLQRFYDIEASGWKGRTHTAIAATPARLQFYNAIARSFSKDGALLLHFLTAGETTLAASFGLMLKNCFIGLKSAYREEHESCAPGHLLLSHILQDLYTHRVSEIHFGLDADYMHRWTSHTRMLSTCVIFNNTRYGRLLHLYKARLRPALRSAADAIRGRNHP